jgi:hypothetical protein
MSTRPAPSLPRADRPVPRPLDREEPVLREEDPADPVEPDGPEDPEDPEEPEDGPEAPADGPEGTAAGAVLGAARPQVSQ